MADKPTFEFFPREKVVRLQDAYFYLFLLGTFDIHQFYLGNKKRAYYLLTTCGVSHLLILLAPKVYPFLHINLGTKLAVGILLAGYALGAPVWIWDFITLSGQVRDKKGQADLL